MKIYDFSPFNNENLIARIKIEENFSNKITTCITESNKTFRYTDKGYNFEMADYEESVVYNRLDGLKYFKGKMVRLSRHPWFIKYEVNPWINEGIQRNMSSNYLAIEDDDVVILSDVDEIIDRHEVPYLIELVKKQGIITVGLRCTCFYLNLFTKNWPGPERYSYRVFLMTGKHFKSLSISSDVLRKKGESGRLINEVYCHRGYSGYHHSWLGDLKFIKNKILSYAHSQHDHDRRLFDKHGNLNELVLKDKLKNRESLFPNQSLEIDNDAILLNSVTNNLSLYRQYFI